MVVFSPQEVAKHTKPNDCWIIIDNKVYDVSKFIDTHPGGSNVLLNVAGKDSSDEFHSLHNDSILAKYTPILCIGEICDNINEVKNDKYSNSLIEKISLPTRTPTFGNTIPGSEPSWYHGWSSPYYKSTHIKLRELMREFVNKEIMHNVNTWDEMKKIPRYIHELCYKAGWLPGILGVHSWPQKYIPECKIIGNISPNEWDHFHELIVIDELSRCSSGGVVWGIIEGQQIGLPPLQRHGKEDLKNRICPNILQGKKIICLAITEPYAGSDVASLRTSAKLSDDGKYYIVNGEKKWITNGVFADYFTTAVRTSKKGRDGISLLLIERTSSGIDTKQMLCGGVWCSGTSFITFTNVYVPIENLLGEEGCGFKYIMENFNHERWGIIIQCIRFSRICYEESIQWALKRKTFGKYLIEHDIIREKLANMIRQIEASFSQIENITYQLQEQDPKIVDTFSGGPIALLKAHCTKMFEYCAREAVQIFGGTGYTRTGVGSKVERLYREVRAYSIPGGSEEIMLELGIRQILRALKKSSTTVRNKL